MFDRCEVVGSDRLMKILPLPERAGWCNGTGYCQRLTAFCCLSTESLQGTGNERRQGRDTRNLYSVREMPEMDMRKRKRTPASRLDSPAAR
ncbi:hypothetical protein BN1723_009487 [Verticillium longisporum]|uniref:Uncharacterized protein n=1 Tax=Verticillium longisporum TaxID=100787 RepID=A0A0G4KQL0_VERLO|nr:hypothetical protein BN1723_009487 [Verticillium longisporum]